MSELGATVCKSASCMHTWLLKMALPGLGLHWGVSLLLPQTPTQTLLIRDEWLRGVWKRDILFGHLADFTSFYVYLKACNSHAEFDKREHLCLPSGRLIKMLSHLKAGSFRYGGSSLYNSESNVQHIWWLQFCQIILMYFSVIYTLLRYLLIYIFVSHPHSSLSLVATKEGYFLPCTSIRTLKRKRQRM